MQQTALILGSSGRFGRASAEAFAAAGWQVRRFDRARDDLMQAARGADVIVNGWNPAYPDWATNVPHLTRQVIAAAKAHDATVIVPGNVYVYGDGSPQVFDLTTPHAATNPLGRIRIEMEQAYRASGVRTILLRAGDFIDTQASGNWFDLMMTPKIAQGRFTYPGRRDIPHAWAYLPDMARAAVMLAERRDTLNRYEEVGFPGYTLSGDEMAAALEQVTGRALRVKPLNWLPLRLAAPVWKMGRCLVEMRYLWNLPHRIGAVRFDALLPGFRHTPLDKALASALPQVALRPAPAAQPSRSTQISR
ncbi:Nucleoside-diphosphate-sugar epimerase [Salinihabitans flavidus]|uniref:Nucleoside-diphosphate-sugar epimerase n=1 Tax=Salinihabitans flavidus TaxID=569882 RepID=A0A1H8MW81_9RHOB|nr:epimerase [Salinihabitans flavidus]SEO21617.1 Nucleoside-diphosphate-sugar epimerase [Salinihabitans flavidus]